MLSISVFADFDYVIGPEYAQDIDSQNMWLDGSNGIIREYGGQTFISPYTLNLTGFKFKAFVVMPGTTIRTRISLVDEFHHPTTILCTDSRPMSDFASGAWNTWAFASHCPLVEGTEYAIWWDGVYTYTGTKTIFVYMADKSIYDYDGGGEIFKADAPVPVPWTGGEPSKRDWIMNLTYYGTEPIPEETIVEVKSDENVAGNIIAMSNLAKSNNLKQAQNLPVCDEKDFFCKLRHLIILLRDAILRLFGVGA